MTLAWYTAALQRGKDLKPLQEILRGPDWKSSREYQMQNANRIMAHFGAMVTPADG